ncbi:hypothetical protein FWK35_00005737, partial [Aphis craccivora]
IFTSESDPNKSTSSSSSSFTFGVSFSSGLEDDCVVFLVSNDVIRASNFAIRL